MGIYLYAVGPSGISTPDATGFRDAPVRRVEVASLTALVSSLEARPEPSLAHIRIHDAVIRAATRGVRTPLPARFGQWFATAGALEDRLRAGEPDYRRALATVRGRREFAVRIQGPDGPRPDAGHGRSMGEEGAGAGSGRAYMEALLRRSRRERETLEWGRRVAEALRGQVGPFVRAERLDAAEDGVRAVSLAHLVSLRELTAYRSALERWRRDRPERIAIQGPWPPYSFAA